MKNLAFVIICCLAIGRLCADTYYVSPAGSDQNSGRSPDRAFQIVQHAIDQMSAGDTLIIMDGFYHGQVELKSGIAIKAQKPRKVVFSGLAPLSGRFERHTGNIYKTKIRNSFLNI